jgi:hypothetical protein
MTHTGEPFLGAPASGRHVEVTGTSIYRISNGKILEHWANMDFLGVLQQLGLAPNELPRERANHCEQPRLLEESGLFFGQSCVIKYWGNGD